MHNPLPFIEYLLGIIISAYNELEERVETIKNFSGEKTQMVYSAVQQFKGKFTFGELINACPLVSKDMVRKVLNNMKKDEIIKHNNKAGKASKYWLNKNNGNNNARPY